MKRKVAWFLLNGLFAAGIYFAFFEGVVGAERVVIFYTWVLAIISLGMQTEQCIKLLREKGRSVPKWIDVTFDLAVMSVFVWVGAWFTAAAYFFHFIFYSTAWSKATNET